MKKKLLSLFLALVLVLGCLPLFASAAETSGTCGENVTWTLSDEGVLTISGNGEMAYYRGSSSPWYNYRNEIKTVVINEGVSRIFLSAFQECSKLVSIMIPDSGMNIFENNMSGCSSLESIQVGENNPVFASKDGVLFSKEFLPIEGSDHSELSKDYSVLFCYPMGKSGEQYTIPDGVTSIKYSAFSGCSNLTSITIPASVTKIENYAFINCSGLTSITIPAGVTSIGSEVFTGCFSLTGITVAENNSVYASQDGVLFNKAKTELLCCPQGKSGAYVIPGSVTSIGTFAFSRCSNLTSITIPASVASIGGGAFEFCYNLASITIPNSVTSIGGGAFEFCGLTSVTIPASVTEIGEMAFTYCDSLTEITVSETNSAYASRDGVLFNKDFSTLYRYPEGKSETQYVIPNGVTSIARGAFESHGSYLTDITIPDSVIDIGRSAFWNGRMTSVTIPNSVTSIGERAFGNCSNLKKAIFMGNAPTAYTAAFDGTAEDFCIYYKDGATGWTTPTWTSSGGDTYPCKPISEDPDQPSKTENEILIEQAQAYGLLDHLGTTVDLTAAMTRLDMAKLLADFAEVEVDEADAGSLTFTDCDDLTTEEKALLYALCQAGYIAGYEDGTFGPAKTPVRCEAVLILDRMLNGQNAGKPQKGGYFTDVPDSAWYANFINSLYETGVLTTEKGTFSPNAMATTEDVLRWFVAAHEKKANGAVSTISLTGATTVKVGETITLTAATSPAGLKYSWSSSDKTVAAVSNGRVSGVKAGSAAITVRLANGNSVTVNISVTASSTTPITPVTPPTPSGGDDEPETPTEPTVETETSPDGTVTTTTTWTDGKKAVQEKAPDGSAKVEVTSSTGETIAKVNLPADPGAGKEFEDVKEGAWYEGAVDKATAYGLFNGQTETTFAPNGSMTRGMVAQVLYNLSGKTGYGAGSSNFVDVAAGKWYENAIDWAAKANVVSGTGNGNFSPEQSVTREQLVSMLYRYAQAIGADTKASMGLGSFPDGNSVSDYAKTAMQWAVAEGFISGRNQNGGKYIAPNGTATRAEVAAILTRFVEFLK